MRHPDRGRVGAVAWVALDAGDQAVFTRRAYIYSQGAAIALEQAPTKSIGGIGFGRLFSAWAPHGQEGGWPRGEHSARCPLTVVVLSCRDAQALAPGRVQGVLENAAFDLA